MKHKVSELEGVLLDAAVALADDEKWYRGTFPFEPSTSWSDGGPIIERERISVGPGTGCWYAHIGGRGDDFAGPTPLIAVMRAYISAKFGDEVDLP